ncbi:Chitinase OS=Streptomyces cyaneofuscatus OX=66883 GN=G3I52_00055 PE=4 SV=1 [Streptomyces cyaneofuscatus]
MTATPAASAASPGAEPCAPLHSASVDYRAGDTVSHHGRNWTAKWWSRRESGCRVRLVRPGRLHRRGLRLRHQPGAVRRDLPGHRRFYTYQGLIDALHAYPRFANTGTPQTRAREAAAFLTHADFESVGLKYVKEINEANYWRKCDDTQPFGCPAGREAYYGRGPNHVQLELQLQGRLYGNSTGSPRLVPVKRPAQEPSGLLESEQP